MTYVARKVVLDDRNPDITVTDLLIKSGRESEIYQIRRAACIYIQYICIVYTILLLLLLLIL